MSAIQLVYLYNDMYTYMRLEMICMIYDMILIHDIKN